MKYLVTGGCGFLGSNIAHKVLEQKNELIVFDNLYRFGSEKNLEWLRSQGKFKFIHGDIRNANDVERLILENRPDVIFHLAGQVAMTTSIANPRLDFEINALGSFNLLEAVRNHSPNSIVIYSSTNKVYGDLEYLEYEETATRYSCKQYPKGFDESICLDFHSPYGSSKGAADQYMLDYARIYNLKTVVFRHSSIYGSRQFSTVDQGWIGWFCQQALEIKQNPTRVPFTISGNGKQVRDALHASDAVEYYFSAASHIDRVQGKVFNIGGGIDNSLSLLELFTFLEESTGTHLTYEKLSPRASDQKVFVANISRAEKELEWSPKVSYRDGIGHMLEWVSKIGW